MFNYTFKYLLIYCIDDSGFFSKKKFLLIPFEIIKPIRGSFFLFNGILLRNKHFQTLTVKSIIVVSKR